MSTKHHSLRTNKNGFTLIELLVIIAIIAILASILFPVFARARENARRSSCASNLKQIGLSIMQYAQDFDEVMPPAYFDGSCYANIGAGYGTNSGTCGGVTVAGNFKWMDLIYPYAKSEEVFNCPSMMRNVRKYNYASGLAYGHYAANSAYYGPNGGRDTVNAPFSNYRENPAGTFVRRISVSLAQFQAPSTTVMVGDARAAPQPFWILWDNIGNVGGSTSPSLNEVGDDNYDLTVRTFAGPSSGFAERHLSTTNVLWADGHVKAVNLDTIATTKTVPVSTNGGTAVNKTVYTAFTIEDD